MKDIETAITAELKRQGKQAAQVTSLTLDNKFKATSIKGLGGFNNLRTLSLSTAGITTLEGFPNLPRLKKLILSDNRIPSGLEHLSSLSSLIQLDLSGNRLTKLEELAKLKSLKLKSLDLLGCPVEQQTPDFRQKIFAMLSELEYLDSADKNGVERDADEEEEEDDDDEDFEGDGDDAEGGGAAEEEEEEDEYEEEGDDEGVEEGGEVGVPAYAALVGAEPLDDDPEEYEEEAEEDDDEVDEDEDDEEDAEEGGSDKKRKRPEEENAGPDDEEEDDEADDDE